MKSQRRDELRITQFSSGVGKISSGLAVSENNSLSNSETIKRTKHSESITSQMLKFKYWLWL
jgi:hypothetical protein